MNVTLVNVASYKYGRYISLPVLCVYHLGKSSQSLPDEEVIKNLRQEITKIDEEIADKKQAIVEKNDEIAAKDREIQDVVNEIRDLDSEIDGLESERVPV